MSYLYQSIMGVPGLTGSWQQRNAQYYKALGSPMGKYTGSLQQNLYLLDQIKKKNFPQAPAPAPAQPAPVAQPLAQPEAQLSRQYTDPITRQLTTAAEIPQFENVMPFYDAWERLVPQAQNAAESQVNPEAMRQYGAANRQLMSGLTSSGGQRFGQGLAGIGNLKAEAERSRQAQIQDWLGSYQKGFSNLFYDPSRSAWNQSRTQIQPGQTLEAPKMPTWDELSSKYGTAYGTGESSSPFYG